MSISPIPIVPVLSQAGIQIIDGLSGQIVSADIIRTARVSLTSAQALTLDHNVGLPILKASSPGKRIFIIAAFISLEFKSINYTSAVATVTFALAPPGSDISVVDPTLWLGTFVKPQAGVALMASSLLKSAGGNAGMTPQSDNLSIFANAPITTGDGNLVVTVTYLEL